MLAFVLRRLVLAVPLVFGIVLFTFLILHMIPGDPAQVIAGPAAPAAVVEEIRESLGLNRPLPIQFIDHVWHLVQGDLGRSIITRRSVSSELARTFPFTLELVVGTLILTLLIGVPLGILAARVRGSMLDSFLMVVALVGITMPVFTIGLALLWFFGFHLQWLPIGGRGGTPLSVDGIRHLVLPVITLASYGSGIVARLTRATMLEVLAQDYIRTAQSKGLAPRLVVFKHALKNASLPIVTVLGLQFGVLIGGAVVTETVFSWPGVGRLMIQSIVRNDFPIVQGGILILSLSFITLNLLVDLAYGWLDPRIQYE